MRISAAGSSRLGSGGFTLFEIIVVLAIVALVTALSAPALASRMLERPEERTARRLRGLVSEGRQTAASTSRPVALVWAPDVRRFTLVDAESGRTLPQPALDVPSSVQVEASGLAPVDGQGWDPQARGLLLLPLGGSTGGEVVVGAGDRAVVVRVERLSGIARYASPRRAGRSEAVR